MSCYMTALCSKFSIFLLLFQKNEVKVLVVQLCLTLCSPTDCSPPGSSVHRILQARILVWVAVSSSRGSSDPGIEPGCPTL